MVPPSRIAFGSCNHQDRQNNMWPIIQQRNPAAFIWGGDAIYADHHLPIDWSHPTLPQHQCATPPRLRQLYNQQKRNAGYRQLLKSNTTIFGTFDDHDYGCDNSDGTYEFKYESGMEYIRFLGLPSESPMSRRAQAGFGVYGVKLFDFDRLPGQQEVPDDEAMIDPDVVEAMDGIDFPTTHSNRTVAIFVLDVRSNKSPWKQGSQAYRPDYSGDFLGEAQWQWFESAIRRSNAAVNVIVSGLQIHANSFPNANIAESWGKFPRAQQRLFDAVLQEGVQSPILVSGDVHMTQLSRKDCQKKDGPPLRRPLIEMTTSGMTHSWGTANSPPLSDPSQPSTPGQKYFRYVTRTLMKTLHSVSPWNELMVSPDTASNDELHNNGGGEGATKGLQYSLEKNFGEIEFDWEQRKVTLRTMGEDAGAPPLLMTSWTMDQLSGRINSPIPGSALTASDFADAAKRPMQHEAEWICINHRGSDNFIWQMIGHVASVSVAATMLPFPFFLPCLAFLLFSRRRPRRSQEKSGCSIRCMPVVPSFGTQG